MQHTRLGGELVFVDVVVVIVDVVVLVDVIEIVVGFVVVDRALVLAFRSGRCLLYTSPSPRD